MDETKDKERLVKEISRCFDEIEHWRKTSIDETVLSYEQVKEIDLALGRVWLIYLKLLKLSE